VQPLTAQEVLQLWERGAGRAAAERAFLLLARARADLGVEALTAMTVGQSEAALLDMRVSMFGRRLSAVDNCPACATTVEVEVDAAALATAQAPSAASTVVGSIEIDNWKLALRAPTIGDLIAIGGEEDASMARILLLERCLPHARTPAGDPCPVLALPPEVQAKAVQAIEERDPAAQLTTTLECPDCHHSWQAVLSIAAYLWTEIAASARRLLREVHELAIRYGWSEDAILGLSATRRHAYLAGLSA